MEEFTTYEFSVLHGKDKRMAVKKFLLILLYIGFVLLWLVFGVLSRLVPLLALIPVTLWMLIFFTWRYVKVEYEYSVTSGVMTLSRIYGGRTRKKLGEFKLKNMTVIAPFSNKQITNLIDMRGCNVLFMLSMPALAADAELDSRIGTQSKSVDGRVFGAIHELDGVKTLIIFKMTDRMYKICRFYNPGALILIWNRR